MEKENFISELVENQLFKLEESFNEVKLIDDINLDLLEEKVFETSDRMSSLIRLFAQEKIEPDSDKGKQILEKGSFLRNLGHKILNLFEIHLSVSFAGVTLFVFDLPKIKNNEIVKPKKEKIKYGK